MGAACRRRCGIYWRACWSALVGDELALLVERGVTAEARYWILYDLDRMKLSEHGGSVDGSWLTDKGREVLDALQEEDIDELADEHWCIHGFSVEDANHNCFAPPMGAG